METSTREIVVRETKPATEWIDGRAVRKVSPRRRHAELQLQIGSRLLSWAKGRGTVGSEWRFRLAPSGEVRRPLVPDIAYISSEHLAGLTGEDLEVPPVAPDLVVEILSPSDRRAHIDHKIEVYLASGTAVIIVVDPIAAIFEIHDSVGMTKLADGAQFCDERFPGLRLPITEIFDEVDPLRQR